MAQARSIGNVTISWGLMQGSMKIYKATVSDQFKDHTRSFCDCGTMATQKVSCPSCGKEYGKSYEDVPLRGYEWTKNKWVKFVKAVWEGAKGVQPSKNLEIEKVVPLKELVTKFATADSVYILPDEKVGGAASSKLYQLLIETLGTRDEAILTHLNLRGTSKRLAIIANEDGILVGQELQDLRELPFVPGKVAVTAVEKAQMDMMLSAMRTNDASFPAPEDGRLKLIEDAVLAETGAKQTLVEVEA